MRLQHLQVGMRVFNWAYPQNGRGTVLSLTSKNGGPIVRYNNKSMGNNGLVDHYRLGIGYLAPTSFFLRLYISLVFLWQFALRGRDMGAEENFQMGY